MMLARTIETIQRREGGRILAGLIQFCGNFDAAEEALQEAYLRALVNWPTAGFPDSPAAWLTRTARNAFIDRRRRERRTGSLSDEAAEKLIADEYCDPSNVIAETTDSPADDQLRLIFTCCHPSLSSRAQSALALKTICQLSVVEIARAYLESETTTAQRLVRAKKKIAEAKIPYRVPPKEELPGRLDAVLHVIYLVFNEGYAAATSRTLIRADLCAEAIRLAALVTSMLPNEAEPMGLLAMMKYHDARRAARIDSQGDLIPLEEQDRAMWNQAAIDEASALLDAALLLRRPGPYQIEAAIAALHCNANRSGDTDWQQISALYGSLWRHRPTDIVALNAAVAHAMAFSIDAGLARIDRIAARGTLTDYHLLHAARADLFRRQGDVERAKAAYSSAIALCTNESEMRYLGRRLAALG